MSERLNTKTRKHIMNFVEQAASMIDDSVEKLIEAYNVLDEQFPEFDFSQMTVVEKDRFSAQFPAEYKLWAAIEHTYTATKNILDDCRHIDAAERLLDSAEHNEVE